MEQLLQAMHLVAHNRRPGREPGIALVLVLWVLALLSVIAGSLVFSSRTEVLMAGNLASLAQAEAAADAGVYIAVAELARPQKDPLRWKGDGLTRLWEFRGARAQVTILDESAKVDLNSAPPALLKGLFLAAGLAEPDADALSDAVTDWRDQDDLRSLHGAEKAEYASAGRNFGPANAPFETIEELRQVLGVSDELFRRLEPLVTVHSRQAGINTDVAPREVLLALPGASPEQVDTFMEQRRALLEQGLPAPPFPGAVAFSAAASGSVFSIQVEAVMEDNSRFLREAVVRVTTDVRRPMTILAWRAPTRGAAASGSVAN